MLGGGLAAGEVGVALGGVAQRYAKLGELGLDLSELAVALAVDLLRARKRGEQRLVLPLALERLSPLDLALFGELALALAALSVLAVLRSLSQPIRIGV
ncbi:MAG: hypothetical protein K6V73_10365 [Firmicutes bacterium]|nr:hypothetical protein [Bacillota bacterium]